jgi:hypothetical protein
LTGKNHSEPNPPTFCINGQPLASLCVVKDLGVWIDSSLTFSNHVDKACASARQVGGVILKCISSGRVKTLLTAYKCYVRPLLEYGSQVYGSCNKSELDKLEGVQHWFTRIIFLRAGLKKGASYEERLEFLSLEPFVDRIFKLDLCYAHKFYHNLSHCPGLLSKKTAPRELKHKERLKKEPHLSTQRSLFFSNRVVKGWNSLPDSALKSEPLEFKKHIAGMKFVRD